MKHRLILLTLITLTGGAPLALAQVTPPVVGSHEFTLGGSGASDKDFDDSAGGINFSYGWYTSERVLWSIRQSVNYINPENSGSVWNGSTRVAMDYHFGTDRWRPLIGANVGYVYGDSVNDTWAAGVEAGVKYYVTERSFVYGIAEYAWLFDEADDIEDTFSDGGYRWTIGIGVNF